MAENSKIEWTHHTFNPWIGCTKVHTGCAHCYAEEMMDHRYGKAKWGPHGSRVRTSDANWRKPLAWDRAAAKAGERHRVFCASLADVFEDWQGPILGSNGGRLAGGGERQYREFMSTDHSWEHEFTRDHGRWATMADLRADLFTLIDATPNLDWLLLTKRPENVQRMWLPHPDGGVNEDEALWRHNVWLGTSISDQATANEAVPKLLECRPLTPVLFLSAEPLIDPIDMLTAVPCGDCGEAGGYVGCRNGGRCVDHRWWGSKGRLIDWIIVGGESGANRRQMFVTWARELMYDCENAGVPFFMKQIDKVQEIPDDLMVRQFPTPSTEPASV